MKRRPRIFPAARCCLVVGGLALGCATAPIEVPEGPQGHAEAAYLLAPLRGYPRSMGAADAEALRGAHHGLVTLSDSAGARQVAERLLVASSELEPARVLLAQAEFVDGDFEAALLLVTAVAEGYPEYEAAQLLAGRSAEKLERVTEAFEIYSRVRARSPLAGRRAASLRERAIEIAGNRTEELLARGRWEEAAPELERLESWAGDEVRTLELVARLSAATADPVRELSALRRLDELEGAPDSRRRRALLELEVGEAGRGLEILERLVEQSPTDAGLEVDLERAKFRWRVNLLPEEVIALLRRPELVRAEHAKLLFWLFPDVRYGRAGEGRIASDILDHPHRQEIARVVNLGLMRVDPTLHLFYPDRPLSRRDALKSVLSILDGRRPKPACLGEIRPKARLSTDSLCRVAARCGLLAEPADCLPGAGASGAFVEGVGFAALDVSDGR